MDERNTTEDEQGEPSTSSRITQLKRRRDELALAEEERALLHEIAEREQRLASGTPASATLQSTPSVLNALSENEAVPILNERPPAQRRRLDVEQTVTPSRGPKIEKIPTFEGKGIREYHDFETRLQIAFRLDPMAFSYEDQKIAFTLQYLQPTYRQLWMQRELEPDGGTLDWRSMMEFLLNLIKSPINRELQVTLQYSRTTQKEGQSVNEFAAYLATLENQIEPPYEQKHLMMHLYSKLRPEVRIALSNYADFPKTRRELVERASTLEDNLRRGGAQTLNRGRTSNSTKETSSKLSRTTTSNRTPVETPASLQFTRVPHGACNYCHKLGHWEQDCRKKAYDKKNGKGPATGVNAVKQAKN
ncbi:hypothetical protein EJ02DRAFT_470501 [Clathrospora elynae]|uniref:CCHC-type domain-containing protein n=1 Tax=Clathrospora elynae TaxID=706981 RepID=A0A6A5S9R8_9PLEO|nr:hypothetical protein EJ02DRAFT_470501 [Clathrospora elynae]